MGLVPRKKAMGLNTVEEVGSEVNTSKNPKNKVIPERKTFKEQAIEVINILKSKGIDIYDPNRTPGMYLKNHKGSNKNIIKFLGGNNNQNQQTQQNQEIEETAPKSIIDFLSKK